MKWKYFMLLLYPLALLQMARLYFGIMNSGQFSGLTWGQAPAILLYGIRFDLIAVGIIFLPFFLFFFFWGKKYLPLKRGVQVLYFIMIFLLLCITVTDSIYFKFQFHRINRFDLVYMYSNAGLAPVMIRNFWVSLVAIALVTGLSIWFLTKRPYFSPDMPVRSWKKLGWAALPLLVVLLAGWDFRFSRNLTPASVFYSVKPDLAPLTSNAPVEILYSFHVGKRTPIDWKFMDDSTAFRLNPVIHTIEQPPRKEPLNLVILMIESASREDFIDNPDRPRLMPFLDSLMGRSLVFTNFFSNALNSAGGFDAIIGGLPQLAATDFYSTGYGAAKKQSLPDILNNHGYATSFFYGVKEYGPSLQKASAFYGFSHFYGPDQFHLNPGEDSHAVGLYDHIFFPEVARKMEAFKTPFFTTIFNLCTHYPFDMVPDTIKAVSPIFPRSNGQSLYYLDGVYRDFFNRIKGREWYEHTIFLFVGDHYSRSLEDRAKSRTNIFRIPMFIFAPGLGWQGEYRKPGQQIDILLTALDLLHCNGRYFSLGASLADSTADHAVVLKAGPVAQLIDGENVLYYDVINKKVVGYFNYYSDPGLKQDLYPRSAARVQELLPRLQAFLQTFSSCTTTGRLSAGAFGQ